MIFHYPSNKLWLDNGTCIEERLFQSSNRRGNWLVHFTCHGRGLLEIKCPSNHKESLELWYTDPNCPVLSGNMKTNHPCYYQVQHQMLVTNLIYCDFYVWSNGKTDNDKLLVRIEKDTALCETMIAKHVEVFDK